MKKFSKAFNEEIYRTVKSFNQRVDRAEKRGLNNLPDRQSVAELKARYSTVNDMKKELGFLRQMNLNRRSLDIITTAGGAKMTQWEFDYLKGNLNNVKKFYDTMLKVSRNRYGNYPYNTALKTEVLNLEARRAYLNRNINELSRSELLTFRRYMQRYKQANKRADNYFDKYLMALGELGKYNEKNRKTVTEIRKKINGLSPALFEEIYKNHDIISDLFDFIISPPIETEDTEKSKAKFNYYNTQAINDKIDVIQEKLDLWIEEAQGNLDKINLEGLTEEEIEIYNNYIKG